MYVQISYKDILKLREYVYLEKCYKHFFNIFSKLHNNIVASKWNL